MNSLDLIASLRRRVESIHISDEISPGTGNSPLEYVPGSIEYASDCLKRYNYEAYSEIKDPETTVDVVDVDDDAIMEFESILDAYMDAYAPNRLNLKNYIKLVSLYLTFVAKRPLHPPSIMAPDCNSGSATKRSHYCVAGKAKLDERFPICRYCVAWGRLKQMDTNI
jgi:uncharacterized protein (UPF0305 family)